jgi:hypothetical protein
MVDQKIKKEGPDRRQTGPPVMPLPVIYKKGHNNFKRFEQEIQYGQCQYLKDFGPDPAKKVPSLLQA